MATRTEISLRVADDEAKSEATLSMTNSFAYSNTAQAKDDEYTIDDIPTLELNGWVLDGTKRLIDDPSKLNWGIWSNEVSDENGAFTANPVLTGTTAASYSTVGITITFGGDTWPKQTVTTWFSGASTLAKQTDDVDGFTHFIDRVVNGFNKVTIELVGTDTPYRRIRIAEIDWGEIFVWKSQNILSAQALEGVDLTSSELAINTLNLSVRDEDSYFNMLNPGGIYSYLKQKQQFRVTEYVNGIAKKAGFYYLKTWANSSASTADFSAQDILGVFDTITYKRSSMWSAATFPSIVASILGAVGFTRYSIDQSLSGVTLSGYIPVVTVREALHQACFAARASVIRKRDGTLLFVRLPSSSTTNAIEKSQKHGSQTITQNDLVNSVAVTAYAWKPSASASQLYSATLDVGTYEITFGTPATSLGASGATITASGINYAVITVATAGTVTITGYQYQPSTSTYTIEASGLTNAKRSQATVSGIFLVSPDNAEAVAEFVYDDYQRRIAQNFSIVVNDEEVGDNVDVDTMLGARKTGVITRMNINLAGGFTADLEVRG